jgi:hypothetical protein
MRNTHKISTGKLEEKRRDRMGDMSIDGRIMLKWLLERICSGYGLDDGGFESRQGLKIFLFTTASRPALETTQPPIQWVPGALSLGVEQPEREADQSSPSSSEVKNAWSYTSTPPLYLHGVVLS